MLKEQNLVCLNSCFAAAILGVASPDMAFWYYLLLLCKETVHPNS